MCSLVVRPFRASKQTSPASLGLEECSSMPIQGYWQEVRHEQTLGRQDT